MSMWWNDFMAGKRVNRLEIRFPGRARTDGDGVAGAAYLTLKDKLPVARTVDGSLSIAESGRPVAAKDVRPAPLAWVNSVSVEVDRAADAVRIGISVGDDANAFFVMEALRDAEGRLWLRVPHPERDQQPGKLEGGRLGLAGAYWVTGWTREDFGGVV